MKSVVAAATAGLALAAAPKWNEIPETYSFDQVRAWRARERGVCGAAFHELW